jgi:LDH2 family malate/lactate/ureidoglycolate dehydrogenase
MASTDERSIRFQRFPAELCIRQTREILMAWGFRSEAAGMTAEGLVWADLAGIASHGLAMLPIYEGWLAEGRFDVDGAPSIQAATPVSALVDGGGTLGFWPATVAMTQAIERALSIGVGIVAVRHSNHFGAAGIYAEMASAAGLIGMATTSTHAASVVPTRARVAMFGTNPIAFAAPAAGDPFMLDMATSTVALGKLMSASYRGEPIPEG